jgi:hypothetical protein
MMWRNGAHLHGSAIVRAVPILFVLTLAGCGGPRQSNAPIPGLGQGDGEAEWGGTLSCTDCDGIDTHLLLRRQGNERRYQLLETYLAEDGDLEFAEQGEWKQVDAGVLELHGDEGGQRTFAVVDGGGLQLRVGTGDALRGREDDVLLPQAAPGR